MVLEESTVDGDWVSVEVTIEDIAVVKEGAENVVLKEAVEDAELEGAEVEDSELDAAGVEESELEGAGVEESELEGIDEDDVLD